MSALLDSKVALVSTTSMSAYLGVSEGSAEEEEMDLTINAASVRAADITGRGVDDNGYSRLLSTARTEYYDGDGTDTLMLKAYPVTTVASVYVDTNREYGSADLLDTDDYVWYGMEGTIKTDGALFASGNKSIKVTYTGGYSTVPSDLQLAVRELVLFWYKRNTDKRVGVSSVSVGDKSVSYETDMPQSVMTIFKRYKDYRSLVA